MGKNSAQKSSPRKLARSMAGSTAAGTHTASKTASRDVDQPPQMHSLDGVATVASAAAATTELPHVALTAADTRRTAMREIPTLSAITGVTAGVNEVNIYFSVLRHGKASTAVITEAMKEGEVQRALSAMWKVLVTAVDLDPASPPLQDMVMYGAASLQACRGRDYKNGYNGTMCLRVLEEFQDYILNGLVSTRTAAASLRIEEPTCLIDVAKNLYPAAVIEQIALQHKVSAVLQRAARKEDEFNTYATQAPVEFLKQSMEDGLILTADKLRFDWRLAVNKVTMETAFVYGISGSGSGKRDLVPAWAGAFGASTDLVRLTEATGTIFSAGYVGMIKYPYSSNILRFFAWLVDQKMLKRDATLTLFGNKYIGTAVERYVKDIVHQHARTWAYAARLLSSFVAAARFVVAQRGGQDPNGSIAKLTALHSQSTQQARIESKFSLAEKPAGFLDWDAVQRVRAAAETALRAAKTDAAKLKGVRDVTVLRLLADQPPDRVGVTRTLQLGRSLKRKDDCSYELDLSQPGAHKTAAVFGATRTTINLDRYIELAGIHDGGFLFHAPGDPQAAASPSTWTERVKAIFARHGDVAFCPKDARSSFITFLRSGDHDDEAVKAAAIAMRHSSKTAASAAYDKGASDRRVSAAMKVAADYSAKFTAGASSSTDNQ